MLKGELWFFGNYQWHCKFKMGLTFVKQHTHGTCSFTATSLKVVTVLEFCTCKLLYCIGTFI